MDIFLLRILVKTHESLKIFPISYFVLSSFDLFCLFLCILPTFWTITAHLQRLRSLAGGEIAQVAKHTFNMCEIPNSNDITGLPHYFSKLHGEPFISLGLVLIFKISKVWINKKPVENLIQVEKNRFLVSDF